MFRYVTRVALSAATKTFLSTATFWLTGVSDAVFSDA